MADIGQRIAEGAEALGVRLGDGDAAKLALLLTELERWNRRINLTAVRDTQAMVAAHVLDSLAVLPYLHGASVLDIGTGAGFPGLPLAVAAPERAFVLLDGNGKKVAFVEHAAGLLGLSNVIAVRARAEDYAPGRRFDTVIARALGSIARLTELSTGLLADAGRILALKGQYPTEELEGEDRLRGWDYRVAALCVPGLSGHERHVVCLERSIPE